MEIEHTETVTVPKRNSGRPKGSYSEVGAAIRRLNIGDSTTVSCLTGKRRVAISSLAFQIGRSLQTKYISRYSREKQSVLILRIV